MWTARVGWFAIAVLGLASLLIPSGARAAEIEWRAPEHCPDADELRFRVERAIAMPLTHAAKLRFRVTAAPSGSGFAARIEVATGQASGARERVLTAAACNELADMVTVAVALALGADPNAIGAGAATPADTSPVTVTEVAANDGRSGLESASAAASDYGPVGGGSPIDTAEGAPAAQRPGDGWRPGLALWLLADSGSLPAPAPGAAIGVQLERAYFQLRALGTALFGQHESLAVAGAATPGADLALWTGALSACATPFGASGAALVAQGCAGWELGRLTGEGTGVQRPRAGSALWSAPRIDLGARWALGSSAWRLGAQLTLALPLARENFVLNELGSVHRAPSAVGRVALGLEWVPR
jgi:hypothetical protein